MKLFLKMIFELTVLIGLALGALKCHKITEENSNPAELYPTEKHLPE